AQYLTQNLLHAPEAAARELCDGTHSGCSAARARPRLCSRPGRVALLGRPCPQLRAAESDRANQRERQNRLREGPTETWQLVHEVAYVASPHVVTAPRGLKSAPPFFPPGRVFARGWLRRAVDGSGRRPARGRPRRRGGRFGLRDHPSWGGLRGRRGTRLGNRVGPQKVVEHVA